ADRRSRELLERALPAPATTEPANAIDIVNSLTWPRSEMVRIPAKLSTAGDRVTDDRGNIVPSQRLKSGGIAILVKDIPPISSRRFIICPGASPSKAAV